MSITHVPYNLAHKCIKVLLLINIIINKLYLTPFSTIPMIKVGSEYNNSFLEIF